jgi:hypothetical protein
VITDEQVRIALAVWFEERDYAKALSPTSHSMRSMRQTLEAVVGTAVGGPLAAPDTDAHGWHAYGWRYIHPVHGTFFIGRLVALGEFSASRVFDDPSQEGGLGCHRLGNEFATLADAQAAVAKHIAELDATSGLAVSDGNCSECLEACR